MSNIRVEVTGHTTLYMDIPELIMTGIDKSVSISQWPTSPLSRL